MTVLRFLYQIRTERLDAGAPHFACSPPIPSASQICDPPAASGKSARSAQHAWQPSVTAPALLPPLAELLFLSILVSEAIGVAKHAAQSFASPCKGFAVTLAGCQHLPYPWLILL